MKRFIKSLLPMLLLGLAVLTGTSCWEDLGKKGFYPVVLGGFLGTDYVRLDVRMPDGTPVVTNVPSKTDGTISFTVKYAGFYYCTFKYYRIKPFDMVNAGSLDYHPLTMTLEVLENGKYHFRGTDLVQASSGMMDLSSVSMVLKKPAYLCSSESVNNSMNTYLYGTNPVYMVHTYDAKNLRTRTTIYAGPDNSAPVWGTVAYAYDKSGVLLSKTVDAVNNAYDTYTVYAYLSKRLVSVTQYSGTSSQGTFVSYNKYSYNAKGYLTGQKFFMAGGMGVYEEQAFVLDKLNKVTEINMYMGTKSDESDKILQIAIAVSYNAAGFISQCSSNSNQPGGDVVTSYAYNGYNILTGFSQSTGDIGGVMTDLGSSTLHFIFDSETGYQFDISGPNLTETMKWDTSYSPVSYMRSSSTMGSSFTELTYDANGNPGQLSVYQGTNDTGILMSQSTMTWAPAL